MGTGKTGSVAGTVGMANPGWRDGAARPAGRRPQYLPGAGGCQPQPEGTSLGRQDEAGSASASTFPWPCLELHRMGSMRGAAASHHGQGSWLRYPRKSGRVMLPLSPCTARKGVARVRDNKLHKSLDLGTAWEEKARGLISLGIQSL